MFANHTYLYLTWAIFPIYENCRENLMTLNAKEQSNTSKVFKCVWCNLKKDQMLIKIMFWKEIYLIFKLLYCPEPHQGDNLWSNLSFFRSEATFFLSADSRLWVWGGNKVVWTGGHNCCCPSTVKFIGWKRGNVSSKLIAWCCQLYSLAQK